MRAGGGGAKGASYERRICGKLSVWVSGGTRKDVFWRSAMSGGRASVMLHNKRHKFVAQAGDISAVHKSGSYLLNAFIIECKHLKTLKLLQTICGKRSGLPEIWQKLLKECDQQGRRLPMLVARQNRMLDLLITNRRGYKILRAGCSTLRVRFRLPLFDMFGFLLRDVLTDIDFANIRGRCRSYKCPDTSLPLTYISPQGNRMPTAGKSSGGSASRRNIPRLRLPSYLAT